MKKLKKFLVSIIVGIFAIGLISTSSYVNAADNKYLGIVDVRSTGYIYNGINGNAKIWKIQEYNGTSDTATLTSPQNLIYCIKGGEGFGSDTSTNTKKTYQYVASLKDKSSITGAYATAISDVVGTGNEANYNKLIWILDHMYLNIGSGDTARNTFLASIIPNEYYQNLTDDDIDVIQQLAIWYYTNPTGEYHPTGTAAIHLASKDAETVFKTYEELNTNEQYTDSGADSGETIGKARQEAAEALYQYYITNASATYTFKELTGSPVTLTKDSATMQTSGSNYVAGPYKLTENTDYSDKDYTLTAKYTNYGTTTEITPTIATKDSNGNYVTTTKTLKELAQAGTEFYLEMPTSTTDFKGFDMTITYNYTNRSADYWSVANAPTTEQPVVIVKETPVTNTLEATIVIPSTFDMSLRKYITAINGVAVTTSREPVVDTSALKAGTATTATYNHTKDPIKLEIGDIVTYTIRVYNEGATDGYVTEITDHLPANLEYITDDAINKQYLWSIKTNSGTHVDTVTTSALSYDNETTTGENKIGKYEGGDTLNYKDVQIRCKVISTDPMPTKITNIAEITGETDGDKKSVTDRDSTPSNLNMPSDLPKYKDDAINRGDKYIPGQEDDDDFEKVQLKAFDLSLRKFITSVNETALTTSREPVVDTTKLKSGTVTTATYTHSKLPVSVAVGDTVTYTLRIYNEGETDGYANEITDNLPAQLQMVSGSDVNKEYEWKMYDSTGAETTDVTKAVTIKTSYLSKTNDGQKNAYETSARSNLLSAYNDGTTLSYKDIKVECKVISTDPMPTKITNIAEISDEVDKGGNKVTDRDSTPNNVKIPSDLPGYKDDEITKPYVPGQEDDDDFEKLVIKQFDLSLRKFITNVNGTDVTTRIPTVDATALIAGTATTATYNHTKTPVKVSIGDTVIYTLRVYNEGGVDGYANEVTDHLPDQLQIVSDSDVNKKYEWTMYDSTGAETTDVTKAVTIKTAYLSKANDGQKNAYETSARSNLLSAFNGTALAYKDLKVECKVISTTPMVKKITNIAEISDEVDKNGNKVTDRDSTTNNVKIPSDLPGYKDDEITKSYVPGQEDDDDFEKLEVAPSEFDLKLLKSIVEVNGEKVTERIKSIDVSKLNTTDSNNNEITTATYDVDKDSILVEKGDIITYRFRIFNEGYVDGYASQITEDIPTGLKFLYSNEDDTTLASDSTFTTEEKEAIKYNKQYGWTSDSSSSNTISTKYLADKLLTAFGVNNGNKTVDDLKYEDVTVKFEVTSDYTASIIRNEACISDSKDKNNNTVTDRDSDTKVWKKYEDDEDYDQIKLKSFDLALKKFITAVNSTEITTRAPSVDTTALANGTSTTATYTYPNVNPEKDPVLVSNGNIVTYTIRVYNEGNISGYASLVKDDIPEGLEFVVDNDTNKTYRWVMLDSDGNETTDTTKAKYIRTDYLSQEQGEARMKADTTIKTNPSLISAFDGTTLSYKDVKVAFKVTAPNTSDKIVINQAQVSENKDQNGKTITDRDSTPNKWVDGEDDQDIEKIKVQYFDLALRKWVTQAIVNDNGNETVTETGHTAEDDPEDVVKVDIKSKKLDTIVVKFRYKIRVTNQGTMAGYAKEIKDYIPNGLKFIAEDNPSWTQVDDKTITTDQAKDVLLQPGDTTEVEVLLTWINGNDNLGLQDNIAEISKDYNDYNSPDVDSTPNNKKDGEDDIDNAPVILSIQTGQIRIYLLISGVTIAIIASGIILIKKFVL